MDPTKTFFIHLVYRHYQTLTFIDRSTDKFLLSCLRDMSVLLLYIPSIIVCWELGHVTTSVQVVHHFDPIPTKHHAVRTCRSESRNDPGCLCKSCVCLWKSVKLKTSDMTVKGLGVWGSMAFQATYFKMSILILNAAYLYVLLWPLTRWSKFYPSIIGVHNKRRLSPWSTVAVQGTVNDRSLWTGSSSGAPMVLLWCSKQILSRNVLTPSRRYSEDP